MSLIPITVDISRDTFTKDEYGGEIPTPGAVYTGLSATFNYYLDKSVFRHERAGQGLAQGPGVRTRTTGVVIFDPKPTATIRVNDRVVPNPAVSGVPSALVVVGVRTYEVTLQLDVEAVE